MIVLARAAKDLPAWLPDPARIYLRHTEEGLSIRALARSEGCHASTILRKIRKFENRRDDPLVDEALDRLGGHATRQVRSAVSSPPRAPRWAMRLASLVPLRSATWTVRSCSTSRITSTAR